MTNTATTDQQYELVYQGIVEVARRCDGAQTLDGVGFNGQDTKFGRRIAAAPFSEWTDDIRQEAARIAQTYRQQILTYTGVDVSTLDVVKDARQTTNHIARNEARQLERRAAKADKVALRNIDVVDGALGIFYEKGDPDFGTLLEVCKSLPGRQFDWSRKCNVVPPSTQVDDFILEWDFPITPEALALLQAPRAIKYQVTVDPRAVRKVIIDTPYDPALVDAIRSLPGRSWDGAKKINIADAHPAVLALVAKFHLSIHPDAQAACDNAARALDARQADLLAQEDIATVMAHVSRQGKPDQLPAVFYAMLEEVLNP